MLSLLLTSSLRRRDADRRCAQEPNPEDPLNKDAAEVLTGNRRLFEQNVSKAMRGGYVGTTYFERCLK